MQKRPDAACSSGVSMSEPEFKQRNTMEVSTEQKQLTYELKKTIDTRGRYKYKLEDYSLAYAAGKGISPTEARNEIQENFNRDVGIGMKDYLEKKHRENAKAKMKLDVMQVNEMSRSR